MSLRPFAVLRRDPILWKIICPKLAQSAAPTRGYFVYRLQELSMRLHLPIRLDFTVLLMS